MSIIAPRSQLVIGLSLALLMAATRSHHFAAIHHLPDASWAVFFLAGFYLRALWALPVLLVLAGASDYIAINSYNVSDFCMSPAYGLLVPAYAALWLAGRWYARQYRFQFGTFVSLAVAVLTAAIVSELLTGGGFYFLSGRFTDTTLTEFGARLVRYFPQALQGMALYIGAAVIAHIVFELATRFIGTRPLQVR